MRPPWCRAYVCLCLSYLRRWVVVMMMMMVASPSTLEHFSGIEVRELIDLRLWVTHNDTRTAKSIRVLSKINAARNGERMAIESPRLQCYCFFFGSIDCMTKGEESSKDRSTNIISNWFLIAFIPLLPLLLITSLSPAWIGFAAPGFHPCPYVNVRACSVLFCYER